MVNSFCGEGGVVSSGVCACVCGGGGWGWGGAGGSVHVICVCRGGGGGRFSACVLVVWCVVGGGVGVPFFFSSSFV